MSTLAGVGTVDLDAYLDRIGFDGAAARADLDTLAALVLRHTETIPFENLDPFLGEVVRLDLPSLEAKLVRRRRGGYCFEHNLLFAAVLRRLGFDVTGLAGRVVWGSPPETVNPRSHMVLRVDLAGVRYLVDVGFGGQTLTAPLLLDTADEQKTPHGPFRLLPLADGTYVQEAKLGDEWRPTYRFDLTVQHQVDYEVASWYLCTHPTSHFRSRLIAARPTPEGRWALNGRSLTHYGLDGVVEHRQLETAAELRSALADCFLLDAPEGLDAAFARLT